MTDDIEKTINDAGFDTVRLDHDAAADGPVWTCKIGVKPGVSVNLPGGADLPMRDAVEDAFRLITGVDAEFCFSGWGGKLTKIEREIVDDRV